MTARAKYDGREASEVIHVGKRNDVGRLAEHLMAKVLGCVRSPKSRPEYADAHSVVSRIRVEVKACGESNSVGLHDAQITEYERNLPFHILDDTLCAFVLYHSRRWIRADETRPKELSGNTTMISMLKSLDTDMERNKFWAQNIQVVYLLDLDIILGLKATFGLHTGHYLGLKNEKALVVGRTQLTRMFREDPLARSMRSIGMSSKGWKREEKRVGVRFYMDGQTLSSEFTLVSVLRTGLHQRLAPMIASKVLALA